MSNALFLSPHLDDVAFSCGGTLIKLADEKWQTILCTIFTKSVPDPQGFALACQLDKGLLTEIDYMQLRRAEDAEFASIANVSKLTHLDFAEAPHRGYNSAPDLFDGIHKGDEIWREVAVEISEIVKEFEPSVIFAPQGIGNHVDHLQTIKAILSNDVATQIFWYRDTPYAIKNPQANPSGLLPNNLKKEKIDMQEANEIIELIEKLKKK
jgi:LmbE family N-acetylglucosaminyl deacetylase